MRRLALFLALSLAFTFPLTHAADAPSEAREQRALAQQAAADALLAQMDAGASAFDLARAAIDARAATLGFTLTPAPAPTGRAPSQIALDLFERHAVVATQAQADDLAKLDAVPEPTRGALAGVLEAYLLLHDVAAAEFEGIPQEGIAAVDYARLLSAERAMLDAVGRLAASPIPPLVACNAVAPIGESRVLYVDLTACDNNYRTATPLIIDFQGRDTYDSPHPLVVAHARVDLMGDDVYVGRVDASNGGAFYSAGFLADLDGHDKYFVGDGAQSVRGSNGGALGGVGFLFDAAGDDDYLQYASTRGTLGMNGGAEFGGIGFLVDASGNDEYAANGHGANGGARNSGSGLLLDATGDDKYSANCEPCDGTNGGGSLSAGGFLLDGTGNDRYEAGSNGTNGGAHVAAVALLVDGGGRDVYVAKGNGTNGGGFGTGIGFLRDRSGDDVYQATSRGVNGGAYASQGQGSLLDETGDDEYHAHGSGANGGAVGGRGRLVDESGDDLYNATATGVNGGGVAGFLLDRGGRDDYCENRPAPVARCQRDETVRPKEGGAQIDQAE